MPVLLISMLTSVGCSTLSLQKPNPLASKDERADSQMSLARLYERKNQSEQAEQLYRQIVAKDPRNQDAHHRLGVISAKRNRFDEAQRHFETAMSLGPAKVELLNDVGYSLYLQDRLPEAEQVLRKSLAQSPQNRQATNNLGLVLGQQGRSDETFALFKQAGGEAEAYANMAYLHAMNADLQSATRDYGRALSINPELRTAANGAVQIAAEQRKRSNLIAQRMKEQSRMTQLGVQGPAPQALAAGQQPPMGAPAMPMMPPQQPQANPNSELVEVLPGRQFPAGRPMDNDKVVMPAQAPLMPAEPSTEFETVASSNRTPAEPIMPATASPVALPAANEQAPAQDTMAQANGPGATWPKVEPITPASPLLSPEHRPGPPLVLHAGPTEAEFAALGASSESRELPAAVAAPAVLPATSAPAVASTDLAAPEMLEQTAQNFDRQLPAAVSNAGADMFGSLSTAVTTDAGQPDFGITRASYVAAPAVPVAQPIPAVAPAEMPHQTVADTSAPGVERAFAEIVTNNQPPVQPVAPNNRRMAMGNLFAPTQQPTAQPSTMPRYLPSDSDAVATDGR